MSYRIHVVALRACTALVPVGMIDMLRKTVQLSGRRDIEVDLVGAEDLVTCAGNLVLRTTQRYLDASVSNLVLVPAVDPDIDSNLALNADVIPWLRSMYAQGADVASACTGAFILAEAGLLAGRAATTHWAFQQDFAARYPDVDVRPQAVIVDHGRLITAGGATSFLNLTLHIIERLFGPAIARAASQMFLVDVNKAPQSAYALFGSQKLHDDEDILRAQATIESSPLRTLTVEQLARKIAMSPRTFARRFRQATGNSPLEYIQRVKVEAAKRALERGDRVGRVGQRLGYSDAAAFRKLFARITGLSPADYRARYGPRTAPSTETPGTQ